ncbi:hypothetical protein IFT54_05600 [Sphingomonas sp. CFBP 13714]|uniref:hypothetical protein n=1 Tax=Sphingomonas sp. CFBP 13714 TaxID=2775308 RepID=UPI001785FB94|nr:hypothetical protein [Sphingomonas sp. CFBP 13714]MBD8699289.1 hypothetical protein [Sphingomonas sp. CFBP 13714]
MKLDRWKTLRPQNSRSFAIVIVAIVGSWIWRQVDPEGWAPVSAILGYWWIIFPAGIAYILIDVLLMEWFGKRTPEGVAETYVDPTQKRLDDIEAAIGRLHRYVQEIDPELAEERELERTFMSGKGGMFAGADHHDYVRAREKAGKRTIRGHNIWRDPDADE